MGTKHVRTCDIDGSENGVESWLLMREGAMRRGDICASCQRNPLTRLWDVLPVPGSLRANRRLHLATMDEVEAARVKKGKA